MAVLKKAAGHQGRHIFEVAGPTVKLLALGQWASSKIKHCPKISWCLEAGRFGYRLYQSLWEMSEWCDHYNIHSWPKWYIYIPIFFLNPMKRIWAIIRAPVMRAHMGYLLGKSKKIMEKCNYYNVTNPELASYISPSPPPPPPPPPPPDSKVHGATRVLSAPDGPHVVPMKFAIRASKDSLCTKLEDHKWKN